MKNSAYKIPEKEETNIGVHAILITPDGKVLLQQRNSNPNILNSGKISMFGGTARKKDSLEKTLMRELSEELELNLENYTLEKLGIYKKTKKLDGVSYTIHVYVIKNVKLRKLKLHEGENFVVGKVVEILHNPNLTRITRLALKDYSDKKY
jgi:8-oxo-dGTP pyrophosphatase MutT (NUDIX family)